MDEWRVGDYELLQALDVGAGMAPDAALASHPRCPEETFLLVPFAEKGLPRARVLRELRQMKQLEHPANVRPIEWFEEGEVLIIAFEYGPGIQLQELIDSLAKANERLTDEAIWLIGLQLCGALATAHETSDENGSEGHIVHGHLAPDRVRLSWNRGVRVYGLGLPSLFASAPRADGMAAYLPPRHQADHPTAQDDVYSAAQILRTLLSGSPSGREERPNGHDVQRNIPEALARALDAALADDAELRAISSRDLEQLVATNTELNHRALYWNLDVFNSLGIFGEDIAPPSSATPAVGPASAKEASARTSADLSGNEDSTHQPPQSTNRDRSDHPETTSKDDLTVQRLDELFDALPVGSEEPAEPEVPDDDWLTDVARNSVPGFAPDSSAPSSAPGSSPAPLADVELAESFAPNREAIVPEPMTALAAELEPELDLEAEPNVELASQDDADLFDLQLGEDVGAGPMPEPLEAHNGRLNSDEESEGDLQFRLRLKPTKSKKERRPPPSRRQSTHPSAQQDSSPAPTSASARTTLRSHPESKSDPTPRPSSTPSPSLFTGARQSERTSAPPSSQPSSDLITPIPVVRPDSPPPSSQPPADLFSTVPLAASDSTPEPEPVSSEPPPDSATGLMTTVPVRPPDSAPPSTEPSTQFAEEPVASPGRTKAKRKSWKWGVTAVSALITMGIAFAAVSLLNKPKTTSHPLPEITADHDAPAPLPTKSPKAPNSSPTTQPQVVADLDHDGGPVEGDVTDLDADGGAGGGHVTDLDVEADAGTDAAEDEPDEGTVTVVQLPPVVDDIGDVKLLSFEGFLVVRSPVKAEVVINGIPRGFTNTKIKSSCWTRNVRLRDPKTEIFLVKGRAVKITCMETTTITIIP